MLLTALLALLKVTLHPQGPSNAGHVTNMVDTAYMADSVTSLPDETSSLIGALKGTILALNSFN